MTLREILRGKGAAVHTIGPEASLDDAVEQLVRHNVGSLIVCDPAADEDSPPMIGILTERDVLRTCAAHRGGLQEITVGEVMSFPVTTGRPNDDIAHTMQVLTRRRIRHLPVMDEGRLMGMISIGDLVKAQSDQLSLENHYLKNYIQS